MSLFALPISYLLWHYVLAWGDLIRLYRNLSWFLWNFFSIRILLGTLFSPWHRMRERKSKDTAGFLGSLILNGILRFIGLGARTGTILCGLITLVVFSLCFVALLALWLVVPFLAFGFVARGIGGIFGFFA